MARTVHAWPLIVVGMLLANVLIVGVTVVAAVRSRSPVERDYYAKGLAWDESARQIALNRSLGWAIDARIARGPEARLLASVRDGAGKPIRAAKIVATIFFDATPQHASDVLLLARDEGGFEADVPVDRPGLWRARFVVDAAGMRFTDEQVLEVGP